MQKRIWAAMAAWCMVGTSLFAQSVASLTPPSAISPPTTTLDLDSLDPAKLRLASHHAIVVDTETGRVLYSKDSNTPTPIASITKLMTAVVTLDANLPLDEPITISQEDVDTIKHTHSRLQLGTTLSRREMMRLALMSSENRAAAALGHNYPGGITAFVQAMNAKAQALGMTHTHYADSTGLSDGNQSTAEDLVRIVHAAVNYQLIRDFTTTAQYQLEPAPGRPVLQYRNSNALMRNPNWDIVVSKTGFINEAGRCLVMIVRVEGHPITMVMLDSDRKQDRLNDALHIRHWVETGESGPNLIAASTVRHGHHHSTRHNRTVASLRHKKLSKSNRHSRHLQLARGN